MDVFDWIHSLLEKIVWILVLCRRDVIFFSSSLNRKLENWKPWIVWLKIVHVVFLTVLKHTHTSIRDTNTIKVKFIRFFEVGGAKFVQKMHSQNGYKILIYKNPYSNNHAPAKSWSNKKVIIQPTNSPFLVFIKQSENPTKKKLLSSLFSMPVYS